MSGTKIVSKVFFFRLEVLKQKKNSSFGNAGHKMYEIIPVIFTARSLSLLVIFILIYMVLSLNHECFIWICLNPIIMLILTDACVKCEYCACFRICRHIYWVCESIINESHIIVGFNQPYLAAKLTWSVILALENFVSHES